MRRFVRRSSKTPRHRDQLSIGLLALVVAVPGIRRAAPPQVMEQA
jgi:hypothetical protein